MEIPVDIEIYPTDSEALVFKRVAAKLDTLPEYLSFNIDMKDAKTKGKASLNVIDILTFLRDKKDKKFEFYSNPVLREIVKKKSHRQKDFLIEYIVRPYVFFRVSTTDPSFASAMYIDSYEFAKSALKKDNIEIESVFIDFLKEQKDFFDLLKKKINENKKDVESFQEGYRILEEAKSKDHTTFELEKIKFEFSTNLKFTSLMSVFNKIILNREIPFAYINNYFKILKEIVPPFKFKEEEDKIFLYIESKPTVFEYVQIVKKDDTIKFVLDLEVSRTKNIKQILGTILSIFPKDYIQVVSENQIGVNGVFYVPHQKLDPVIFGHLLMNNVAFYKTLAIDESIKAYKTKEGMYVYYNAGNEIVSTVITPKVVYTYDPAMRNKDMKTTFPEGDAYVSVKISRASSEKVVEQFQRVISKIFTLYDEYSPKIVKIYKKFIENFGKTTKPVKTTSKKVFLKDIDPELFLPSYTRSCPKKPVIIEQGDEGKYTSVMLYPKSPEEGVQRIYACDPKSEYKYIGLRKNDPASRHKFVPCCYKVDQKDDATSFYNIYMNQTEDSPHLDDECFDSESVQQKIIITKKSARYGGYGYVTPFVDFQSVFRFSLAGDSNYHYVRRGMDRSKISFLQCVFEGVEADYNNISTCKNRLAQLRTILDKIASTPELLNSGKQCFYNKGISSISSSLSNPQNYLDPRNFIPILEEYFDCNIYVFSDREKSLIIPHHVQNYIQMASKLNRRTIFVLEHFGTEGENFIYPQCELIVKANKSVSSDVVFNFERTDKITTTVKNIFDEMAGSFCSDMNVSYYNLEPEFKIDNQIFNSYGKVSAFLITIDGSGVFMYTKNPLPPVVAKNDDEQLFNTTPLSVALKLANSPIVIERKQIIEGDDAVGIQIRTYLDNNYFILIKTRALDEIKMEVSNQKILVPNIHSSLLSFNDNNKLSNYLAEYIKFLFSYYLYQANITDATDDHINAFVKSAIIVKPGYKYTQIPSRFAVSNEGFIENGKMILSSEELRNRLIYTLILNKNKIKNYHLRTVMDEQIESILDIDKHPLQTVLYGKSILYKFIIDSSQSHTANRKVIVDTNLPYLFRNDIISTLHTYLAVNCGTNIKSAISVINNWKQRGFAYYFPENTEKLNVTVYNYVNESNIKIVYDTNRIDFVILAYREEDADEIIYTTLISV